MLEEVEILDEESIDVIIHRLCHELIEIHNNFNNSVLIGLQPRGTFLNSRIIKKINLLFPKVNIASANIDISFFRDDLMTRETPIVPQVMDINFSLEGRDVILIDDVLFTGRSVRSAIDTVISFGRPKSVELLTLIDRSFSRDLPIQPNYVGKKVDIIESEKVIVEWKEQQGFDRVLIRKS